MSLNDKNCVTTIRTFHEPNRTLLERFSIECRETKTKVITLANHKDTENPTNQSEINANMCSWREARENVSGRVTISFGFTSDWIKKWREFFLSQSFNVVSISAKTHYLSTVEWKPLYHKSFQNCCNGISRFHHNAITLETLSCICGACECFLALPLLSTLSEDRRESPWCGSFSLMSLARLYSWAAFSGEPLRRK